MSAYRVVVEVGGHRFTIDADLKNRRFPVREARELGGRVLSREERDQLLADRDLRQLVNTQAYWAAVEMEKSGVRARPQQGLFDGRASSNGGAS